MKSRYNKLEVLEGLYVYIRYNKNRYQRNRTDIISSKIKMNNIVD